VRVAAWYLAPLLLLLGGTSLSEAGKPDPLDLVVEVAYQDPRAGRESRREELAYALVVELEKAGCVGRVVEDLAEADLVLAVKLREFTMEERTGGAARFDERTGADLPGRTFLCRIDLLYALFPAGAEDPIHVDDMTVAAQEATTSNPLFDPKDYALREAIRQAARELRRRLCRRHKRLVRKLMDASPDEVVTPPAR
jgi:hypothetical protein